MHKVGSLTCIIIFSLTLVPHLYKNFYCDSTVHTSENGLDFVSDENQLSSSTKENSEQEQRNHLGLSQETVTKISIPGQDIPFQSERVGDEARENKQTSLSVIFQMSKDVLNDTPSERKRRHSAGQQPTTSQCQRHPLYVNFTTLGWNSWNIAPPGYNAYYCDGECPLQPVNFDSTKHAHIQGLMSISNPTIPKPCCVPTKLSSISMAYTVNATVYAEVWDGMVVEACGCR
ncbi:hypothetical protein ACJMK2_000434 [Sinanodonta woodiana]|uniref:TGF-beta family profile domain-containing protein n=1 Tax=Sinanodonta woodiana TaxID=1069815 RepID=A0ABD3XPC8_SINWO